MMLQELLRRRLHDMLPPELVGQVMAYARPAFPYMPDLEEVTSLMHDPETYESYAKSAWSVFIFDWIDEKQVWERGGPWRSRYWSRYWCPSMRHPLGAYENLNKTENDEQSRGVFNSAGHSHWKHDSSPLELRSLSLYPLQEWQVDRPKTGEMCSISVRWPFLRWFTRTRIRISEFEFSSSDDDDDMA